MTIRQEVIAGTTVEASLISRALVTHTETDTPERTETRIALIFEMFYDDEPSEPDQAIRDALTDLMHVAAARGVDMEDAIRQAARMFNWEREEWEIDG